MLANKKAVFGILAGFVLLGAGCATSSAAPDGGVYRSVDAGVKWESKSDVLATKGKISGFAPLDVNVFATDPSDQNALWVGTMTNGILFSFDGGEGWSQAKNFSPSELALTEARINGIAVDPISGCVAYATVTNPAGKSYIVRTNNCGRSWGLLYTSEIAETQLQAIVINPTNHLQILVGDSVGNVFKSDNAGGSWVKVLKVEDRGVRTIAYDPKNTAVVFAGTKLGGLWKSEDSGQSWKRVGVLNKYPGSEDVYSIAVDPSVANSLLIGTHYGILRSTDGGANWEALPLLTAPGETQIVSLAINPKDSRRVYYGTPTSFYRSEDGGQTWTTKRVPTTRVIKALNVSIQKIADKDTEVLWLAAWRPPQQ